MRVMESNLQTITGVVVGLFTGMGTVLVFVDKQRRAWVTEARAELQAEIAELREQNRLDKVASDARILALEGQVTGMLDDRRNGRTQISDIMVAVARGQTPNDTIEALRGVLELMH